MARGKAWSSRGCLLGGMRDGGCRNVRNLTTRVLLWLQHREGGGGAGGGEEEVLQPTGGARMGIGCGFMEALGPHQPQTHWGDVCLHVRQCRVGRLGLEAPNPK